MGCHLRQFWQIWPSLSSNLRFVSIVKEGYTLPFKMRPPLTRSPGLEQLCKPDHKPVSQRGLVSSDKEVASRKCGCPVIPRLLQPVICSPETKKQMETYFGPQSVKSVSQSWYLQDGNALDNLVVPTERGVGHLAGFQRRILSHPHQSKVKKISEVFPKQTDLSVYCPSFWFGHSSLGVYKGGQGSETHGTDKGYLNPPVPSRLVTQTPKPGNLPTTYPDPLGLELGWGVNMKKSELTTQQVFNFVGYRFNLFTGLVLPTP